MLEAFLVLEAPWASTKMAAVTGDCTWSGVRSLLEQEGRGKWNWSPAVYNARHMKITSDCMK